MPLAPVPDGYATILASGYDSVQEAYNWFFGFRFQREVEAARLQADTFDEQGGERVSIRMGDEIFQVMPHGAKGGFRFVLVNDDMMLLIGAWSRPWTLSVRYLAAGLWEHGLEALRARLLDALHRVGGHGGKEGDGPPDRLSRADFCWDLHAPEFTAEMRPGLESQVIAHSSSKTRAHGRADEHGHAGPDFDFWARGGRLETLTIGSKAGLQIQVYDKGLEITEASGKTWMLDVWRRAGYVPPETGRPRNVWRLEIRMGKEWLKDRNIRRYYGLADHLGSLLRDALMTRRLTVSHWRGDSNRRRWPLHPIWQLAADDAGAHQLLPVGRQTTLRRDALVDMAMKQLAGTARAASVLATGDFDRDEMERLMREAVDHAEHDPNRRRKVEKARERYALVDEAR